jgi:hypothetical protein
MEQTVLTYKTLLILKTGIVEHVGLPSFITSLFATVQIWIQLFRDSTHFTDTAKQIDSCNLEFLLRWNHFHRIRNISHFIKIPETILSLLTKIVNGDQGTNRKQLQYMKPHLFLRTHISSYNDNFTRCKTQRMDYQSLISI